MASRTAAPSAVLLLRLVTLALLATSLAIIAANKFTDNSFPGVPPQKYTFKDVYAYRYLLAVAVIGCALHLHAAADPVRGGERRSAETCGRRHRRRRAVARFRRRGCHAALATGAAAALGFSYDAKRYVDSALDGVEAPELVQLRHDVNRFLALAFASAGLMLGAAACVGGTLMVCVYSLVK